MHEIRLTEAGLLRVALDATMLMVAVCIGYEVVQWRAYVRQQPEWWWHDALVERIVTIIGPRVGWLAMAIIVPASLAGWTLESLARWRWVGPRWDMRR